MTRAALWLAAGWLGYWLTAGSVRTEATALAWWALCVAVAAVTVVRSALRPPPPPEPVAKVIPIGHARSLTAAARRP